MASDASAVAAGVAAARRPTARADVLPPSGKLTRSRSASGPSRRSQGFLSNYYSGPVGALPRHTMARTRPSTTHQHAHRPNPPSEACPLTTSLAPFRADRVTCATTTRGLASASAEALPAELERIFVSAPARVERGASARPRARQSQRSATHAVVQRLYACVVPGVAWEERGLCPLVCERDQHGSR